MDYNIITNIKYCADIVNGVTSLLFYSHIPTAALALFLSIYIYLKNRDVLLSKILVCIGLIFSLWCAFDLLIWFNYDRASWVLFAWSPIELFAVLLFSLCFYFVYVFLTKKDLPWWGKLLVFIPIVPIILLSVTKYNLVNYDIQQCIATENHTYLNYTRSIKIGFSLLSAGYLIYYLFKKQKTKERVRILFLAIGMLSFLYAFLIAGYIGEVTDNYVAEIYGLFAMVIFLGSLTYLIVAYAEFNIELIGAQALVFSTAVLIASEFFFVQSGTNQVLVGITFAISSILGFYLVRGVKKEIAQREEIETLAEKLEEANVHLEDLNKQKTEFVSLATHQIRAPLAAIKGYSSLVLEGDYGAITKDIKEAVSSIYTSAHNLVGIVGDYLDISRLELGTMKYDFEQAALAPLVAQIVYELQPNIAGKSLTLTFTPQNKDDQLSMVFDVGKIKQVISNIIDNSIKYTDQGSIVVSLAKKGDKALISVKDTGVGIEAATIPKLFKRFSRADDAHSTNILGTGLGLFIANQMVTAHHGRIWVTSEGKGKGSQFYIELPTNLIVGTFTQDAPKE